MFMSAGRDQGPEGRQSQRPLLQSFYSRKELLADIPYRKREPEK